MYFHFVIFVIFCSILNADDFISSSKQEMIVLGSRKYSFKPDYVFVFRVACGSRPNHSRSFRNPPNQLAKIDGTMGHHVRAKSEKRTE